MGIEFGRAVTDDAPTRHRTLYSSAMPHRHLRDDGGRQKGHEASGGCVVTAQATGSPGKMLPFVRKNRLATRARQKGRSEPDFGIEDPNRPIFSSSMSGSGVPSGPFHGVFRSDRSTLSIGYYKCVSSDVLSRVHPQSPRRSLSAMELRHLRYFTALEIGRAHV